MKKLFSIFAVSLALLSLGSVANARGAAPTMSAEAFLDSVQNASPQNAHARQLVEEKAMRGLGGQSDQSEGDFPPLFTYQVNGQAYWYISENERCVFGGHPTKEDLNALLDDPSVATLNADGPLAILRCPDRDIVVRVKHPSYRELQLAYTQGNGENDIAVTLSSWPLRNSPGYERSVFDAAYVVAENRTMGIKLTHNGSEVFVQMDLATLTDLTGWTKADLKCGTSGGVVSLMIPLQREGYGFPGDTGNAYVSTFLRGLLEGKRVDISDELKDVGCHQGLYDVLAPRVFSPGKDGSG